MCAVVAIAVVDSLDLHFVSDLGNLVRVRVNAGQYRKGSVAHLGDIDVADSADVSDVCYELGGEYWSVEHLLRGQLLCCVGDALDWA